MITPKFSNFGLFAAIVAVQLFHSPLSDRLAQPQPDPSQASTLIQNHHDSIAIDRPNTARLDEGTAALQAFI